MASKIKVDQIEGSTGTSVTIPTGHTFTVTDGMSVAGGGTGLTSFTAGDVLYATGSTTLAKLPKGTAEQVLAMNSGATAPDWGSVDLTVLPTITVAKGGTNLSSFTAGDVLYATGSTTLAKLAKGSAADVLTMNAGATAPEWAAAAGGSAITEQDSWRVTSDTTGNGYFTANWERTDTDGYSVLGTGLTESSGVFTFPSTGYWLISTGTYARNSVDDDRYGLMRIDVTVDNSAYTTLSDTGFNTWGESSTRHSGCYVSAPWDVTSTSLCKFKIYHGSGSANTNFYGTTDINHTYIHVIRLADT